MTVPKPGDPPVPSEDAPATKDVTEELASSSFSDMAKADETQEFHPRGAPPPVRAAPPETPKAFGRYEVRGILGYGGFGTVYKGHDTQLDRAVAIKVQRSDRVVRTDKDVDDAFQQEARRLAKLRHPGIVAVHDIGSQLDLVYIVSDFVEGVTLKDWLHVHRPSWQEAVRIVAEVAQALAHAHANRTIHRDIKPANIILTAELKPILVDFGLGLDGSESPAAQRGAVMGTPAYMSPEQVSGQAHRIDGRTDIYGVGVVLYEMLTGIVPFRAALTDEVLRQVCEDEPQPPRQLVPAIPRGLELICLRAMAKSIPERYTTAGDMAEELIAALADTESQLRQVASHPTINIPAGSAPAPVVTLRCPQCQRDNPATALFCVGCGVAMKTPDTSSTRKAATARSSEPERRQLTLLTCGSDLFESADYLDKLDEEEQLEVLHAYQKMCGDEIERNDGAVIQRTEHGLLACFGYPTAHEDAAARAVRAGVGIQRGAAGLRDKGIALAVSVNVHTGMCVVSDAPGPACEAFSITGDARNLVNRLDSVGKPDSVVISQTTHRLVQGYFVCESLGQSPIKGSARPLEFFRVVRESETKNRVEVSASAGLTPLVGRDREVGLLEDRWEQAGEGMGQIVLLIGEAGLGKSRLVHVIKEHVRREGASREGEAPAEPFADGPPDAEPARQEPRPPEPRPPEPRRPGNRVDTSENIVEWRCTPHHQNSSLYPAIEFFERLLGFERDEPAPHKFGKLDEHLRRHDLATADIVPCLAALLSLPTDDRYPMPNLSPAGLKEKTLDALLAWLRGYAANQPVLFIVEDLHWVDPSTLELLAMHVERGLTERVLTLMTFRPEFETPWKSRSHQTAVALNRLTKKQLTDMMQRTTGIKKLPTSLIEQMAAKTDGVPLFVEEYTKLVMESGRLREKTSADSSASFISQEIPATLQDLLAARLDRMASNRDIVQLAATLGRGFTYELMLAVSPLDESALQAELAKLVTAELLYQKGTPPECVYTFKHALIQDAAYLSLLKSKRQQAHERVAEALEKEFEEIVEHQPELLAHHYTEAGLFAKAVAYWTKAGLRAKDRSANQEAISHLHRGLELLAKLPDTPERAGAELGMQIPLGTALMAALGYAAPETQPVFARARTLCLQLGEPTSLMAVLWGIWAGRIVREELDLCVESAHEVNRLADAQADPGIAMEARFVCGLTAFYRGENAAAVEHSRVGISLYDAERCRRWSQFTGQNARVTLASNYGLALWQLGYPDQALRVSQEAVDLARALEHPYSLTFALHHLGWLQQYLRNGKGAQTSAEAALAIAHEQGFSFWKGVSALCRAKGLLLQDRVGEALDQARLGLEAFLETGAGLSLAHYYSYFAEVHQQLGQHDLALRGINEALAASAKNRNEFYLAELHRLKGEILWARSPEDLSAVEACFHDSLTVAVRQEARSWELRTAMSLARFWHSQGRGAEARERLAAVYGWFSEGFGTPDLIDAKKLLEIR